MIGYIIGILMGLYFPAVLLNQVAASVVVITILYTIFCPVYKLV